MNSLSRFLSALVFALTVSCGIILIWHVLQAPRAQVRYAGSDGRRALSQEVQRGGQSWNLSKLSLFPKWRREKTLVSVMVENHEEARPYHRGLEKALLVEEFFVEGFITRFNALFSVEDFPKEVGPVRSLRPYFIDGVLPWTAVFFHIGGSPEALEHLEEFDDVVAFNGIYRDTYFERVDDIPMPHDAFLTRTSMRELLGEAGAPSPVRWPPYRTGRARSGSGASSITINFFSPFHDVAYVYDVQRRRYVRTNGKEVSAAMPSNVLILETDVEEVGPYGRLAVAVQGEGDALLFRSGRVYSGRWSKASPTEPYVFTDGAQEPLVFASGQTWITVVDSLMRVDWEE